jgi:hypothetical protein
VLPEVAHDAAKRPSSALHGDPDAALELLRVRARSSMRCSPSAPTPSHRNADRAGCAFLRGDYAGAIEGFDQAQRLIRKRTRKRNVYVPSIAGHPLPAGLAAPRRARRLRQVQSQVRICLRASVTDPVEHSFRVIGDLASVLAGQAKPEECYALSYILSRRGPVELLLQTLALHWLGDAPEAKRR